MNVFQRPARFASNSPRLSSTGASNLDPRANDLHQNQPTKAGSQKNKKTQENQPKTPSTSTTALQTRCPNCYTQFYAYPTQLEVHQNLVRCGLCLHIFNARACAVPTNIDLTKTTPSFLKQGFGFSRSLLVSTCILLSILFIILLAVLFRAKLLENFPRSIALLRPACRVLACNLPPVRAIDSWAISHSELRPEKEPHTYLLLSTLQNLANFTVELPAIEISLLNTKGELILRRTLDAHDYLSIKQASLLRSGLEEASSLPIEVALRTGEAAVNYRLFLLYP